MLFCTAQNNTNFNKKNIFFIKKINTNQLKKHLKKLKKSSKLDIFIYTGSIHSSIKNYLIMEKNMKKIFKLFKFYSPLFEKILKKYNLPKELKYLPIIESNLNSKITSSLGTKGLWQFTSETAQIYGLIKNNLYDERNDPIKSTEAAAKYLKDLYNHFHNWTLVIAAYNCGSNIIDHVINNQKTRNVWKLIKFLPKQTRNYIFKFIAINYIMNQYYKENYIKPKH